MDGYETWSLTQREEHRLRVFENRVLRREEVAGGWRELRDEGLATRMRWAVHVARMLEMNNAYKFLVETLLGKRPHG
jgi:hypothetical protein